MHITVTNTYNILNTLQLLCAENIELQLLINLWFIINHNSKLQNYIATYYNAF